MYPRPPIRVVTVLCTVSVLFSFIPGLSSALVSVLLILEVPGLLVDTQLDSEVLESEAHEAVLDTLGEVLTEPSELEVVWEEAFDSC